MEYAISLLHYHRYEQAEPVIEKCLTKFKEWDTEEEIPFEYSKYYNKIALVRMYQGRFDEAIKLAEDELRHWNKRPFDSKEAFLVGHWYVKNKVYISATRNDDGEHKERCWAATDTIKSIREMCGGLGG